MQNMKLVTTKFKSGGGGGGYMRSMQWQLGILGTISAFAFRHRETKKNLCRDGQKPVLRWPACVEMTLLVHQSQYVPQIILY